MAKVHKTEKDDANNDGGRAATTKISSTSDNGVFRLPTLSEYSPPSSPAPSLSSVMQPANPDAAQSSAAALAAAAAAAAAASSQKRGSDSSGNTAATDANNDAIKVEEDLDPDYDYTPGGHRRDSSGSRGGGGGGGKGGRAGQHAAKSRESGTKKANRQNTLHKRPMLECSLALCYIGLRHVRSPILIPEIVQRVAANDVPFLTVYDDLPNDLQKELPTQLDEFLRPRNVPSIAASLTTLVTRFPSGTCSRSLMGCFGPPSEGGGKGGKATHQRTLGAVACCLLLMLTCVLF